MNPFYILAYQDLKGLGLTWVGLLLILQGFSLFFLSSSLVFAQGAPPNPQGTSPPGGPSTTFKGGVPGANPTPPPLPGKGPAPGGMPANPQVNPQDPGKPLDKSSVKPPDNAMTKTTARPKAPPKELPYLSLSIEPVKTIFRNHEGLPMKFIFKAYKATRLCLEKDPMSQFQFQVLRGGAGMLPIAPLVVTDTRELYFEKIRRIDLKPGDIYPIRANLKRFDFSEGEKWLPGDYTVSATFNLCDQSEQAKQDSSGGKEIPIKSTQNGRFIILN
ncbi:MAG: hypothetical protein K2X66_18085 [Cyanobacteria bacterium]|nr:hypothetical protein [Cyanobacteriota bacterium]